MQSYQGVQHFFEKNITLFSKRLTAVQSSVKEVKKKLWEEGSVATEWNPLSNHFDQIWYSLKRVLLQVCAKPPSQGSEPFD